MSAEIVAMLSVGGTLALLFLGILALLDRRIDRLENNVVRLEGKVDVLASDHQSLARAFRVAGRDPQAPRRATGRPVIGAPAGYGFSR